MKKINEYKVFTVEGRELATFFADNDKEALNYFVENFDDTSLYYKKVETEEES